SSSGCFRRRSRVPLSFFFQAEDGIRDFHVTGVQTCALPIYPALNGTTYQITLFNGGNPNLEPEEADTMTVGVVFQPSYNNWLDGFQVSLDWYSIQVDGLVGSLGQQRIVDECFAGNTTQCQYIERDPASGQVNRVFNVFQNINAAKVSGVDAEIG